MNADWQVRDTTTHQDHVIAHVVGTRVLGYFVLEEALYLLLDIGFVWMIFLDGEMGLLPHPVAVSELEIAEPRKDQIKSDIDALLTGAVSLDGLRELIPVADACQIKDVSFFADADRRRLIVTGEEGGLTIETSLATAEIKVYEN